jgi:pimeloyl-ACP methyl ester carboxylesterase
MQQSMPRARLSVVERAGHAVHLEQPEAFAALVAEFLGAPR